MGTGLEVLDLDRVGVAELELVHVGVMDGLFVKELEDPVLLTALVDLRLAVESDGGVLVPRFLEERRHRLRRVVADDQPILGLDTDLTRQDSRVCLAVADGRAVDRILASQHLVLEPELFPDGGDFLFSGHPHAPEIERLGSRVEDQTAVGSGGHPAELFALLGGLSVRRDGEWVLSAEVRVDGHCGLILGKPSREIGADRLGYVPGKPREPRTHPYNLSHYAPQKFPAPSSSCPPSLTMRASIRAPTRHTAKSILRGE